MDIVFIVFLTLLNGAFAMSELALAASKKARLQALAEAGDGGAQAALRLLANPTQFLSSVQVGITSIGMLNGIVGEAAFSDDLSAVLQGWGLAVPTADVTATGLVVVVITFVTIVFGELVPKRIGQLYPEAVSRFVSRPMEWVARVARPFVALLSATTVWTLKLLRIRTDVAQHVTEEEIEASLEEGVDAGIIEAHEHQMVRNVFLLDDRTLASIMLPRSDIEWLEESDTLDEALRKAWQTGHSWYPVCRDGLDDVVGVVHVPRLVELHAEPASAQASAPSNEGNTQASAQAASGSAGWLQLVQPAVFVPETLSGMELLEQFRVRSVRIAFVVDEYGVVQGLLTPLDLLEAITGELSPEQAIDAWAIRQPDGSWVVDGSMPAQELKSRLALDELPQEDQDLYNTVAGMMQTVSGDLLAVGECVEWAHWRFEVVALDGRRIERVHIRRMTEPQPAA
ncbi:MAG TPA: hemolysin family protein [Burkholderiaceae bacterium]|nr:hemolysin family protein [Burkholderiaceae bacterium]